MRVASPGSPRELARRDQLEGAVGHVESGQRLRIRVAQVGDDRVADRVDGEDVGHMVRCGSPASRVRRTPRRPPQTPSIVQGHVFHHALTLQQLERGAHVLERSADALLEKPPFGDSHFAVSSCRVPQQIALDRVCNGLVTHLELSANAVSFFRCADGVEQPACLVVRKARKTPDVLNESGAQVEKGGTAGRVIADPAQSENAPVSAADGGLAWVRSDPPPDEVAAN